MGAMRSIAFLFLMLSSLSQATPHTRALSASSKLNTLESSTNTTGLLDSTAEDAVAIASTKSHTSLSKKPFTNDTDDSESYDDDDAIITPKTKKTSNVTIPGQQETDYVNTSISQWDITNKSMISMNHSNSNSTSHFLPKERPQSTGWIQTCLGIFLGFAVILFGLTAHQKYRKRMHYEDAPEMQSLVV